MEALLKLNVPQKIKLFMWTLRLDSLPTRANFVHRKVETNVACPQCPDMIEDCWAHNYILSFCKSFGKAVLMEVEDIWLDFIPLMRRKVLTMLRKVFC